MTEAAGDHAVDLPGFEREPFTFGGKTHPVYRAGSGPAVIVVHEIPGLHPGVIAFAQRLVDAGYTAYLPSLFGVPGRPANVGIGRTLGRACISREFFLFADRTQPVVHWLRALAAQAHQTCGGPGVGAVGMCFTGGFALAMAVDPSVLASVLSQPGIPVGLRPSKRGRLGLDAADRQRLQQRAKDGFCALGLRFTGDVAVPPERFAKLQELLGDAFERVDIDSSPGNAFGIPKKAHSVLTIDLVDEPGHPTRDALDKVMALLERQLRS